MNAITPSVSPASRQLVWFGTAYLTLIAMAGTLSACFPIPVAICAVFLFAGPHNWMELRYVLERLPAKAGRLWPFFVVSALGIGGLTASFAAIPWLMEQGRVAQYADCIWQMALLLWIAALVTMRSRTNPRFDAGWIWPVVCFVIAGVWIWPQYLPLTLVYLHPLMAIGLLDQELGRSQPAWRAPVRFISGAVFIALMVIAWATAGRNLSGTDQITLAFGPTLRTEVLSQHSGGGVLPGVSSYFLVAAHTFLELVHYGIWILLLPLVGMRSQPWNTDEIPISRRGRTWCQSIAVTLLISLGLVIVLWVSFWVDYETTRRVYFTIAMFHVLAEVPLLLRMI